MNRYLIMKYIATVFCVIFFCFPGMQNLYPDEPSQKVIAEFDSVYNKKVIVADTGNIRNMIFHSPESEYSHGRIDLNDPSRIMSSYIKCMMISLTFFDKKKQEDLKVLVIGLGAGSIPGYLRNKYPRMHIDVVEIDPVVVSVARKYFYVQEDAKYKIFTDDGRAYLNETKIKYDIIFLDAYGPGDGGVSKVEDLPKQLATIEFFRLVKNRLTDKGILVSNYIFVNQQHYSSFYLSQKKNFPLIYRVPLKYPDQSFDYNSIFITHKKPVPEFNKKYLLKKFDNLKGPVKTDLSLPEFMIYFNTDRVDDDNSVVELHD